MVAQLVDRMVSIGDGIDLHYVEAGEGQAAHYHPLVVAHRRGLSAPAPGALWDAARDGLRHARATAIRPRRRAATA